MILTGTPAGLGCMRQPPLFPRDRDVISASIDGVATLVNFVVAERWMNAARDRRAMRIAAYGPSIFDEISALAERFGAINLGSGSPDLPVPPELMDGAMQAVAAGRNQYSPVSGEPELRRAVSEHLLRFYDRRVDAEREVSVTNGVTEALYASLASLIDPGDEVIVFEPCYDSYMPAIRLAGGVPKPVTLRAPAFALDAAELAAAITPRTKAILLNNPHNPSGKVYSRDELDAIAAECVRHDLVALSDEVYEHIVFSGHKHLRLADVPGMWERTLTLSGASKTFSIPGWRIGWATGPEVLVNALNTFRQYETFCAATPLQLGVAHGLTLPDQYFTELAATYQSRRDLLLQRLAATTFRAFAPAGAYFTLAEYPVDAYAGGLACCEALARDVGVVPIPLDSFYQDATRAGRLVRFAFCKGDDQLNEAGRRLASQSRIAV